MSKLFKLKEWLTVPDAAKHLSGVLSEEITEADVLRLALDGHLKLSVNFVNHTKAKRGRIVSWKDTDWFRGPPINTVISFRNKNIFDILFEDVEKLFATDLANKEKEAIPHDLRLLKTKLLPKFEELFGKISAYEKKGLKEDEIKKQISSEIQSLEKITSEITNELPGSNKEYIERRKDVTKYKEMPKKLQALFDEMSIADRVKEMLCQQTCFMRSINIDSERFLNLDNEITTIEGIWDLPMLGAETLDIEHKYQILTGGPEITLNCIDGCFIQSTSEEMFQLQENNEENQFLAGSRAFCEKMKKLPEEWNLTVEKKEEFLNGLRKARQDFVENKFSQPIESSYYPAGGLPHDSVLVVRTAALSEFVQKIADEDHKDMKGAKESTRKTENLLRALAAIAIDDYGYDPESLKSSAPQDIANATSAQGVNLDAKTIRNWLKEGAALLPLKRHKE